MDSKGNTLFCKHCGKSWTMEDNGVLKADGDAPTEFPHVPDWYEWERENVRKEVEAGSYDTGEVPVEVRSLPNAKKFIPLGKGTMRHNAEGFKVQVRTPLGRKFEMEIPVPAAYSCHIEYNYLGKWGDCVDLNTLTDTWYTYPKTAGVSVTKIALATEELYKAWRNSIGKPCKPGLA